MNELAEIKKSDKPSLKEIFSKEPIITGELYVIDGMRLNRTESALVDIHCSTMNVRATKNWFNRLFGKNASLDVVKRHLEKVHVQGTISRLMEIRGFDREHWKELGLKAMRFNERIDKDIWKELGKAEGFYREAGNGSQTVINNQIMFTQANGEK